MDEFLDDESKDKLKEEGKRLLRELKQIEETLNSGIKRSSRKSSTKSQNKKKEDLTKNLYEDEKKIVEFLLTKKKNESWTKEIAKSLVPGSHASTFGGNPLACAASAAVFEVIQSEGLLDNATKMGNYSFEQIRSMAKELDVIKEVRGIGLMIGIELKIPAAEVVKKCMDDGLLVNCTHDNVIRVMPQLNITKEYIDEGLGILKNILKSVN